MTLDEWAKKWQISPEALADLRALPEPNYGRNEQDTQNRARLIASQRGALLFRNNSGAFKDDTGRWVRYGLGNDSRRINEKYKSSDLIGIDRFGRFLAFECKHPGWGKPESDRDRAQERFIMAIKARGGLGAFITDAEQLKWFV